MNEGLRENIAELGVYVKSLAERVVAPLAAHNIEMGQIVEQTLIAVRDEEVREVEFESEIILNSCIKQWLLSQLPMKVLTLTLLFSGSIHGWDPSRFHEL